MRIRVALETVRPRRAIHADAGPITPGITTLVVERQFPLCGSKFSMYRRCSWYSPEFMR